MAGAKIFDKLEPEPQKMDRLRNTVNELNFSEEGKTCL
jgi:hypothetical protein